MNKKNLIRAVLAQKEELLKAIKTDVALHNSGLDLDEGDTLDPEDFSHQTESGEMKHLAENHRDMLESEIDQIKDLDEIAKEHVAFGSLVITENAQFLMGISFNHFDNEPNLHGVGKGSPIFNAFIGKEKGDKAEVNGKTYLIEEIL